MTCTCSHWCVRPSRPKGLEATVLQPKTGEESLLDEPEFKQVKFSWWKLWLYMGPGWLMSIAFLDPGNIEGASPDVFRPPAEIASPAS